MHKCLETGNTERALAIGLTTDSETSDDAVRLVHRMKQITRCHPVSCLWIFVDLRYLFILKLDDVVNAFRESSRLSKFPKRRPSDG
jgi:hypothetical protein